MCLIKSRSGIECLSPAAGVCKQGLAKLMLMMCELQWHDEVSSSYDNSLKTIKNTSEAPLLSSKFSA